MDIKKRLLTLFCLLGFLSISFGQTTKTNNSQPAIHNYYYGNVHFSETKDMPILREGDSIPPFSMIDTSGVKHDFSQFLGKYVVITVWASYSWDYIKSDSAVNNFKKNWKKKNLVFINLSCDDIPVKWKNTIGGYHLSDKNNFLLLDKAFMKGFQVYQLPRNILISPKGEILDLSIPDLADPSAQKYLQQLK